MALLLQGQLASIGRVSDMYGISQNNVSRIVHQFAKAGVIKAKQGKGDGFHLVIRPEDVNVREMVLLLENSIQIANCLFPSCKIATACVLKDIFEEARNVFLTTLGKCTLADLLRSRESERQLLELLNIEGAGACVSVLGLDNQSGSLLKSRVSDDSSRRLRTSRLMGRCRDSTIGQGGLSWNASK